MTKTLLWTLAPLLAATGALAAMPQDVAKFPVIHTDPGAVAAAIEAAIR